MAASQIRQAAVWALLGLCLLTHIEGSQGLSDPPDPTRPCFPFSGSYSYGYLTVTNKCPHDTFKVAMVRMDPSGRSSTYAMGADATWVPEGAPFQWLGPYLNFPESTSVPDRPVGGPVWVAVLRKADGKLVAPKGVKPDGSLMDVSSTTKRVCQLFVKGSTDFSAFRASLSPDGSRVIRNDFARGEVPQAGKLGTPCEQYYETGTPAVEGRMVDVYDTGSCQVIVDDCRQ